MKKPPLLDERHETALAGEIPHAVVHERIMSRVTVCVVQPTPRRSA
jgi:hypothetical protein